MIDIALHIILIAWYPIGVLYLKAREHKQNGLILGFGSGLEWRVPALVLFPVYVGLMVYFWRTA